MEGKTLKWFEVAFGALLIVGGAGMFLFPDQMVAMLCPRKPLFGTFLIVSGLMLVYEFNKKK